MLYRFTSRAVADLIMLPQHAEHMLKIIGKEVSPQGIIVALEIPVAIAALQAAVDLDSAAQAVEAAQEPRARSDDEERDPLSGDDTPEPISLKRRAAPLLDMLTRSAENNHDVMWTV